MKNQKTSARHAAGISVNYLESCSTVRSQILKVVRDARTVVVQTKVRKRKNAVKNIRRRVKVVKNVPK